MTQEEIDIIVNANNRSQKIIEQLTGEIRGLKQENKALKEEIEDLKMEAIVDANRYDD